LSLDKRGFRGNGDRVLAAAQLQLSIQDRRFADGENKGRILVGRKAGAAIDSHLVLARGKSDEIVASAIICDGGALGAVPALVRVTFAPLTGSP